MTPDADQDLHHYAVRALHDEDGRTHLVEAASFEDAALEFIDLWPPDGDEVAVMVVDRDSGARQCFRLPIHNA